VADCYVRQIFGADMTTRNTESEGAELWTSKKSRRRPLLDHLKQVLWALFLVYIILLGLVFLFGKQIGYEITLWACLGVAGLVTVTFFSIYLCDLLRIVITDQIQRTQQNNKKQKLSHR
jgi:hypothetical protein